ncbi:MAG: RagB/SusD family nutrient uptake outer membrane protein [Bacteroidaceae bacterium]|nr:RagB/SusD family nutrient uptake outer membrane protein [Bacteroidaceae bacterium]
MKIRQYIISGIAALCLASCSEWLDVQPTTEKDRDDLVQTAEGYKQMLYGTYINLTSQNLYGSNLSYGFLEVLANSYANTGTFFSSGNYNYTDATERSYVDGIWSSMYNNIANVNSILLDIDEHKEIFKNGEYQLLAGEAYAMRAFMHFDLLRMFAPRYEGHENETAIPYIEKYEAARYPHITSKQVIERVLRDLNTAQALLKEGNDPILDGEQTITYNGSGNFKGNRQYRFNYWAVEALKARIYLYTGNKEHALTCAENVINSSSFRWIKENEVAAGDMVFQSELILALDVPNLPTYYDSNFKNEKLSLSDGWGIYGQGFFGDANDYRFLYLMSNDKNNNKVISSKYKQTVGTSKQMKKQTVPLIRLGEMYLIAAECQAERNPQEAVSLLRELKLHRGYLAEGQGIDDNATTEQINGYIRDEMRKETYGEGQHWFYMKRLNLNTMVMYSPWGTPVYYGTSWSNPITEATYKFPLPESEKEYGNIPANNNEADTSKQ